ncbi:hypothetical protein CHLRE_02g145452v5 [Chlamydomonas reinhardtii]|uniref:Uncharacterized protein n=1 Tax=Chlamydomonas reinhardtii TaxID=3055 RepID=A8J0V9_CHLRE|nr:uncharacterized protein CHLRE_02g145452v5 [Chlamydomonas reinhardtii]PNW87442.1 hypothetical protein CHLRE_02g145452v5 [Chlamydomonas reinhardtii]|eukprot:XP_001695000.1 predicted protein [Chlamydomonas reinhardtii]
MLAILQHAKGNTVSPVGIAALSSATRWTGYVWLDADAAAVKPHPPALYGCAADVAAAGVAGPRASPLLAAGRPWGLPFASEGTLGSLAVPTRLMSTTSVSCRSNSGSSDVARSQPAGLSTAAVATEGMPDPKQAPVAAPQAQVQKMPTQQASTQQQAPAQQGGWDDDAESPPIPLDPNVKPPGMAFVTAGAAISALLAVGVAALGILGTFYAGYAISQIAKELKKPESGLGAVAAPATAAPAAAGVAAGAGATAAAAGAPSKGAEAAAAGKAASKAASSQPGAGGGGDGNMQAVAQGEGAAAAGPRRGRSWWAWLTGYRSRAGSSGEQVQSPVAQESPPTESPQPATSR